MIDVAFDTTALSCHQPALWFLRWWILSRQYACMNFLLAYCTSALLASPFTHIFSSSSNINNRGSQITENCHNLLTTCKAEARQTRSMTNNLGAMSDSWERQVEAGASGVPQDLGKLGEMRAEGLDPLGEPGKGRIWVGIQKGTSTRI